MAKLKEEVIRVNKFTKFVIYSKDGKNKEVTAPRRMTTSEALHHFNALAVGGVEQLTLIMLKGTRFLANSK